MPVPQNIANSIIEVLGDDYQRAFVPAVGLHSLLAQMAQASTVLSYEANDCARNALNHLGTASVERPTNTKEYRSRVVSNIRNAQRHLLLGRFHIYLKCLLFLHNSSATICLYIHTCYGHPATELSSDLWSKLQTRMQQYRDIMREGRDANVSFIDYRNDNVSMDLIVRQINCLDGYVEIYAGLQEYLRAKNDRTHLADIRQALAALSRWKAGMGQTSTQAIARPAGRGTRRGRQPVKVL